MDHELVAHWLRDARRIVVLTGAGISTESGIADFRGPQGTWTRDPAAEKTATLSHYLADVDVRRQAWRNRVANRIWDKEPNAAHLALVELERRAALDTLVTQNIDGLHQRAGSDPNRIVEIHGSAHGVRCMKCRWTGPMVETIARVEAGEDDPRCCSCGGILKSTTISFGESLVPADLERARDAAAGADLFLALGSSLVVQPAANLPRLAMARGARLVVLNAEPTPLDDFAAALDRGRLGTVLPALVELV